MYSIWDLYLPVSVEMDPCSTQDSCLLPNISQEEYTCLLRTGKLCSIGSFGIVHQCVWRGRKVAIKSFNPLVCDSDPRIINQVLLHAKCHMHPNVADVFAAGPNFPNECTFYVVELAENHSLDTVLHQFLDVKYSLAHAINWMLHATKAADHLHRVCSPPVCHGDLKPANMLLFDHGRLLKLGDFGSAGPLGITSDRRPDTCVYTAPEIAYLRTGDQLEYTDKCDVYSLSITFWELLARRRPYEQTSGQSFGKTSFWNIFRQRPSKLLNCPPLLQELYERGWSEDPQSRPSAYQIVQLLDFLLHTVLLRTGELDPLTIPSDFQPEVVPDDLEANPLWSLEKDRGVH
ncbi:unnamed protein product [Dicrocoelium dendriticum]|nr:unnamed protein product [Dicrocoelium dendriticum]